MERSYEWSFAEEYWEACKTEIATLEGMVAWEVVKRTVDMNVIPSTWKFKCKRFPGGLIKKFKARFCARGDRQIEGVDFFEKEQFTCTLGTKSVPPLASCMPRNKMKRRQRMARRKDIGDMALNTMDCSSVLQL